MRTSWIFMYCLLTVKFLALFIHGVMMKEYEKHACNVCVCVCGGVHLNVIGLEAFDVSHS